MLALLISLLREFAIADFPNKNALGSEVSFCAASYLSKGNAFGWKGSTCKSLNLRNGDRSVKYNQYRYHNNGYYTSGL